MIIFAYMETQELLRLLFPPLIADNFAIERVEKDDRKETLDIYLSETKSIPKELESRHVVSYGFTEYATIQDFSIRGYITTLHVRRRKWQEKGTGKIHVKPYDLTRTGTQLTKEFASFLKETCRVHGIKPEDYR